MTETKEEVANEVNAAPKAELQVKHYSTPIVKTNANYGLNRVNFFDDKQLVAAENFLTKVMRSEKGGIKTVNDGLAVLMRAQDLNLPFSSCLEHIHVINGKTGVDVHIIKALLLKAGCVWECLNDYQPLYEYTDGFSVFIDNTFPSYGIRCNSQKEAEEKAAADMTNGTSEYTYLYPVKWYQDFNGNVYKDYQLNTKHFGIAINKQQVAEIVKSGRTPVYRIPNKPVDYITSYKFTRVVAGREITAIGKFTYSDAMQAELFEKDTYKKYPKVLIGHRAFTLGARDIASDVLFGVMETTELKVIAGKELTSKDVTDIEDIEVIEI